MANSHRDCFDYIWSWDGICGYWKILLAGRITFVERVTFVVETERLWTSAFSIWTNFSANFLLYPSDRKKLFKVAQNPYSLKRYFPAKCSCKNYIKKRNFIVTAYLVNVNKSEKKKQITFYIYQRNAWVTFTKETLVKGLSWDITCKRERTWKMCLWQLSMSRTIWWKNCAENNCTYVLENICKKNGVRKRYSWQKISGIY